MLTEPRESCSAAQCGTEPTVASLAGSFGHVMCALSSFFDLVVTGPLVTERSVDPGPGHRVEECPDILLSPRLCPFSPGFNGDN